MKSIIASLSSLTLPYGAGSGQRIVLDGVNGQIAIYNTENELIGTFDPNGLVFYSNEFNPARIFQYDPIQNLQTIYSDDGTETSVIQLDGRPDTLGVWVIDAASGGYVRMTPDADGSPGIEFSDASGTTGYLVLPGTDGSYANTPANAALDITGDIDIRIDVQMNDWTPSASRELVLKWPGSGSVDWEFRIQPTTGRLRFVWTNATDDPQTADSTAAPVPDANGRLALRVTMDVDNGAGGRVVTFYTAPTIGGTWTQLGSTVTGAQTAIFGSNSRTIRVGGENTAGSLHGFTGKCYAFQLRSGIGGTLVASPDFTIQSAGTSTFVDSAGRTWNIQGSASVVTLGGVTGTLSAGANGDILLNGHSIPRGPVKLAISSGNLTIPASASPTAYVTGITATDVPVEAGRRYRVTSSGWFDWVTGGSGFAIGDLFFFDLAVDTGGGFNELTFPGFQQMRTNVAVVGRFIVPTLIGYFDSNADGIPDFIMRAKKQAGASTVSAVASENGGLNPGTLLIEDIGATP